MSIVRWNPKGMRRSCVKKTRKRHAVRKMEADPPEPSCRRRLQTAVSCFRTKAAVVNVTVKRRGNDHVMWGLDRRAKANLWVKHRNRTMTAPKPGFTLGPGSSMEGTYLLAMRCPVQRRRESSLGFRAELENLVGDGKGKGPSGGPARPKVLMRQPGADCSVVAWKRGNSRGAKGAGHPRRDWTESTGNRRNSLISAGGGSLRWVARAG